MCIGGEVSIELVEVSAHNCFPFTPYIGAFGHLSTPGHFECR